ncbi:MAG: hypothetical protein Q8S73_36830 [Deltaproteobacteria bacterium]|nr:hypothetical protein [Myxococcales bacterium]MDP3219725.1 hypothetical protein [Deltaproteobacteria bacterium]
MQVNDAPSSLALAPASDCDVCPHAEALYLADGEPTVCSGCRRVYADDDFRWPEERPSQVVALAPPVRELAAALADVRLVRRWRSEERERLGGGPAEPTCSIGRLLAASNGAARDATPAQVERFREYLLTSETATAVEVRRAFRLALVDRLERSLPREVLMVDPERVAPLLARLEALPPEHARVLEVVARRDASDWEAAVAVVAEELLPRPQVRTWHQGGRPRVDRTSAPPEVVAEAQAEEMLAAAVRAWGRG